MTGKELRAKRKLAGLSQVALAQRAGVGRNAISYWENKAELNPYGWATTRIAKALGLEIQPIKTAVRAGARAWGLTGWAEMAAQMDAAIDRRLAERRALAPQIRKTWRVLCGAKTRKGESCRNMSEAQRQRCRFHGGKSTGPKTDDGKARIAAAQKKRWELWRIAKETD